MLKYYRYFFLWYRLGIEYRELLVVSVLTTIVISLLSVNHRESNLRKKIIAFHVH